MPTPQVRHKHPPRTELALLKRAMEQYLRVEIDDQYAHAALHALKERLYNNSNHCI